MYGWGGTPNNVNAQVEADRLARLTTENRPEEEDPADERAERITNAARTVVGSVIVIAGAWVLSGTTAAFIVAAVVGLVTIAVVLRRRSKNAEVEP